MQRNKPKRRDELWTDAAGVFLKLCWRLTGFIILVFVLGRFSCSRVVTAQQRAHTTAMRLRDVIFPPFPSLIFLFDSVPFCLDARRFWARVKFFAPYRVCNAIRSNRNWNGICWAMKVKDSSVPKQRFCVFVSRCTFCANIKRKNPTTIWHD